MPSSSSLGVKSDYLEGGVKDPTSKGVQGVKDAQKHTAPAEKHVARQGTDISVGKDKARRTSGMPRVTEKEEKRKEETSGVRG